MKTVVADGQVLVADLRVASSVLARTRGLMFAKPLQAGQGLEIRPCNSIHMMFMRAPIDAVFFDRDGVVLKVAHGLPRWIGLAFGGRKAKGVLELPAGSAMSISPGVQLTWSGEDHEE